MMRSILPVSARMGIVFAAIALCAFVRPTLAIQPTLEKITQEADGTVTYHFKIRIDETIHVEGQGKEPNPDFFTIFNFTGMVPGSEKQPAGWTFSTSTNGVTPYRGGRTVLAPIDVEGIPNLTWSRSGHQCKVPPRFPDSQSAPRSRRPLSENMGHRSHATVPVRSPQLPQAT